MNIQRSTWSKFKHCNPYLHIVQHTQDIVTAWLTSWHSWTLHMTVLRHFITSTNYICLPFVLVQYSASCPYKGWHFDHILVPWYPNTWTYHYFQTTVQPDIMKFTQFCYGLFLTCFLSVLYRDANSCGCDAPPNWHIHSENPNWFLRKSVLMIETTLIITSNSPTTLTVSTETETMAVQSPACHLPCSWYLEIHNTSVSTRLLSELTIYWSVFNYNTLGLLKFPSKILVDLH